MRRRGGRCHQIPDDVKEKRSYWNLKEEALDHLQWRIAFGRGYGHVARQYMQQSST
jgi:hypothetical protein